MVDEGGESAGPVLRAGCSAVQVVCQNEDARSVFPHYVCLRFTTLPSRCNLTEMSFHSLSRLNNSMLTLLTAIKQHAATPLESVPT